jgi:hypothetical protein
MRETVSCFSARQAFSACPSSVLLYITVFFNRRYQRRAGCESSILRIDVLFIELRVGVGRIIRREVWRVLRTSLWQGSPRQ